MRPSSIVQFDRLYPAAIGVGLVGNVLDWPVTVARLESDPATAAFSDVGIAVAAGMIAVGTAIALLLWFLIARRGSGGARWVLVAFTAFAIGSLAVGLASGAVIVDGGGIARMIATALQTAAVALLFRADARAWFATPVAGDDA